MRVDKKKKPNELVDLVPQSTKLVENKSQKISELSSHSKESQKKKGVQF